MDDQTILLRLLQSAYIDDALTQAAKAEFEKFVIQSNEEGMEREFPLNDLDMDQEKTLRNLSETGYTTQALRYHGSGGGHILHVDLRGKKFLGLADTPAFVEMQDSGKREVFETGAVRDSQEGKPRPDLVSPFALERVGHWMAKGAEKYGLYNWQKGMNYSRVTASLYRHLLAFMKRDNTEDNLAAIVANACFLMHYAEMIKRGVLPESLDDLPK
jgi:hypothetical protein